MQMRSLGHKSRSIAFLAGVFLLAGFPAAAQETLNAETAREFVGGQYFTYRCFDGTYGAGRIDVDGSAAGTIRVNGTGISHYMRLPSNTLYVSGNQVCAHLRGLPFDPCFNLVRTGPDSFRGSVSQMNFMYCNFNRSGTTQLARRRGIGDADKKEAKTSAKPAVEEGSMSDMKLRR